MFDFLWSAFLGGWIQIFNTVIGRMLVYFGVGVLTFTGVTTAIDQLKDRAVQAFLSLPPEIIGMLDAMQVDVAVSLIASAISIRLTMSGVSGGILKKIIFN